MSVRVVLLGPQRHVPTVRQAVAAVVPPGATGPVALVSAGWEEREAEDAEFREHLQRPVVNLMVWERVERIFAQDPELLAAMRARHDALRQAQELYRLRLVGLLAAADGLLRRGGDPELLEPERSGALAMVRALDREHTGRVAAVHERFAARFGPAGRSAVAQQRRELAGLLQDACCLCLAGGHVGVLLHRLQLFDLLAAWGDRPTVAWSAGAMVLAERVVLFHRAHSEGPDTEVMEQGFAVVPGIVPLPHARRRLDLRDLHAMQLLARRFEPAVCVPLEDGQRVDWDGQAFAAPAGTRRLGADGRLAEFAP